MRTIPQRDLRNHNAVIMAAVIAGESFVITRNGEPVAELRPIAPGRRTFVSRAEVAGAGRGSGHIDAASFRRDLDHLVDQGL